MTAVHGKRGADIAHTLKRKVSPESPSPYYEMKQYRKRKKLSTKCTLGWDDIVGTGVAADRFSSWVFQINATKDETGKLVTIMHCAHCLMEKKRCCDKNYGKGVKAEKLFRPFSTKEKPKN
jgi:hypothetical protein